MPTSLLDVNVWMSGLAEAASKRWMDAYLAAFALTGAMRLITFDQDFRQFQTAGLDLELLQADGRADLSRGPRPSGSPAGAC